MENLRMRAYLLDENTDTWVDKGIVAKDNFWPLTTPEKMDNGNWIISGFQVNEIGSGNNPPAVAISSGDDFTDWNVVVIPIETKNVWGESSILIDGPNIINIARWGEEAIALASKSADYGQTWSKVSPSNLPMSTSKPYSGRLSSGEYYLIGATYEGVKKSRKP